jgi:Citrate synthase
MSDEIKKGLLGIVVDETEVSKVMPEINSLTYRGYAAQDLCAKCKFKKSLILYLMANYQPKKQLKKF